MIYTLIGKEEIDYVSKKTNKRVIGIIIYLSTPIEKNGAGVKVEKFYISSSHMCFDFIKHDLPVCSEIELLFNQYGQIAKIMEV